MFDLHEEYSYLEGCKLLVQYENILKNFGDLKYLEIFSGYDEEYESVDGELDPDSYGLPFKNIDEIKQLIEKVEG